MVLALENRKKSNETTLHIGINDYPGTGNDLSGCVNDANDWREAMRARGFEGTSLLDEEASKSNMVEAISKIVGRYRPG